MSKALLPLVALTLAAAAAPAAASVRVMVDGRVQEVPDNMIRTISYRPGGHQIVRDEPYGGNAMPGCATITTEETTEEDGRGRALGTRIVTRIEPIPAAAHASGAALRQAPELRAEAQEQASAEPDDRPAAQRDEEAEDRPGEQTAWEPEAATGWQPEPRRAVQPVAYAAPPAPRRMPILDITPVINDGRSVPAEARPLRIRRDGGTGHFIAAIRINGVVIHAIVDTGAAGTILSPRDAQATGADGDIVSTQQMIGIGGYTTLNVAQLRSMEVAGQQFAGFTAAIGQPGLGYTLLGQSEIARLGRIVIEDGMMTITPRGERMASR